MSGCPWLYRWRQGVKLLHIFMITVHIYLNNLHRFNVFLPGFFLNPVFTFSKSLIFKMSYISNVPHISYLILKMGKITEQQIENYCRTGMSEMSITVNSGSAYIDPCKRRINRFEMLLSSSKGCYR